jgi:molybdopterin biosynthesis enzyme MoaB
VSSGDEPAPRDATPREHRATAPVSIGCFVLTISDSKTPETDTSGKLIRELVAGSDHHVVGHAIVRDEPSHVTSIIRHGCGDANVQAFILTGGTGVTSRDSTFEAVESARPPCSRAPRRASSRAGRSSRCPARPTPAGWRSRN